MYCKHFGFTHRPFAKDLPAERLFEAQATREFEVRLRHLVDLRGIGLFTGESGSGKTTVCRKVVSQLHAGTHRAFYIPNSSGAVMDLYKSIAWELGLQVARSRSALYKSICTEITRLCVETRIQPILFIDEAHCLRSDVLEELRILTNYEMDSKNRLCLALIGHPELRRRITMAVHESLNQRVVVRHQMGSLTLAETTNYLQHQLEMVGTQLPIFDKASVLAIHHSTSGLLRKVNFLAHHALNAAAALGSQVVTAEIVEVATPEVN